MENKYTIYLKNNKVQKYRTLKSYVGFKLKTHVSAKINGFKAIIEAEAHKPLKSYING